MRETFVRVRRSLRPRDRGSSPMFSEYHSIYSLFKRCYNIHIKSGPYQSILRQVLSAFQSMRGELSGSAPIICWFAPMTLPKPPPRVS